MAKYWEIRESYGEKAVSAKEREAYECGYEEGYEAAMEEMEKSSMGSRMGHRGGYMGERGYMGDRGGDTMGERRGRDSMGRYR